MAAALTVFLTRLVEEQHERLAGRPAGAGLDELIARDGVGQNRFAAGAHVRLAQDRDRAHVLERTDARLGAPPLPIERAMPIGMTHGGLEPRHLQALQLFEWQPLRAAQASELAQPIAAVLQIPGRIGNVLR